MTKRGSWIAALTLLGACGSEDPLVEGMDQPIGPADGGERMMVNRPPVAGDDTVQTFAGVLVEIDVLDNDGDPDGDDLDIIKISQGEHGFVDISRNDIEYTPNDGVYVGLDEFTYTINDGNGETDEATVTVNIIESPTLVILTPTDSQAFPTGTTTVNVTFMVTGCTFSQPPANPEVGCHAHKYLDGMGYPPTGGIGQYSVTPFDVNVMPGAHTFRLALAVNDGTDALWSPTIDDQVAFTVAP